MAVRDEKQQTTAAEQTRKSMPWRDTFGTVAPILALSAVVLYAYLAICYDRFYGSLGVDPNDVGLSYTGTLARSSGFALGYLLVAAWLAVGPLAMQRGETRHRRENPTSTAPRVAVPAAILVSAAFMVAALTPPLLHAGDAAREVREGKPVGPIRFPGAFGVPVPALPLTILAIHAAPAIVEPAGKPGDSPAAERLQGRKLLYLGQASGTVVLYDPAAQQAVYVPASSIILHVSNCDAKPPPEPACQQI
jgi:hypothetical protein